MKRFLFLTGLSLSSAIIVAIGPHGGAHAQQLVGEGKWQSRSGQVIGGTWSVELRQSGSDLQGTIELTGSTLFSEGTITGTTDGKEIMLGVMSEGGNQVTFQGQVDGESVSGRWEYPPLADGGVWQGAIRGLENGS
jgi:hypothetical protein